MKLPESAKVIIVGGGVIGLSIAYHLGKLGMEDVLLLERNELTSGTSWHAAGIVGPLRSSMNLTKLAMYSTELFQELEQEIGQATGYARTGGYWLAQTQDRLTELKRIAAMGDMNHIQTKMVSPQEIAEHYPHLNVNNLSGGLWVEQDAQVNPVDLCMAYAKGARAQGVNIVEHVQVTGVELNNGLAQSIYLASGENIQCEILINACGAWAREFGKLAGLNIPLACCEHMYIVTDVIENLPAPCPILRDLDSGIYIKADNGKLVIGGFESNAKPWNPKSTGSDRSYLMFDEDWDHMAPMIESAICRIPVIENTGIVHFMNGPESFTPDTRQLMGKVSELDNYYLAAGFNSIGIMSSAGVGKVMAQWIAQDCPPMDLWEVDIQRYESAQTTDDYLDARLQESVHSQFDMHWPFKQKSTGRDLHQSPLHDCFKRHGAVFGVSGIWERPFVFGSDDNEPQAQYSYHEQSWWPQAQIEAQTLMHHVGLIELSPFTKIIVSGSEVIQFLQKLCTKDIDVEVGRVVYTTMLNDRGGIESEQTVTRLSLNEFLLVSGAATHLKDLTRLKNQCRGLQVDIADVTYEQAVIGLMGPKSGQLLESLSDDDFSFAGFRFGHSKIVSLQGIEVRAIRISFVGECGWELYINNDQAVSVFNYLVGNGKAFQLGLVGHYCVDSCRLEKAYLHWGHDIGPDDNPIQAGIEFSVSFEKEFIGKSALQHDLKDGVPSYLIHFKVMSDHWLLLLHDEPIYSMGKLIGHTTTGGIGFRINLPLCFALIMIQPGQSKQDVFEQSYEIEVAGERFEIEVLTKPVYDPNNNRLRG